MVTYPMSIESNPLHRLTSPGPAKPGSALHSCLVVPAHSPLTPLDPTLTKNALNFSNSRRVTPLESIVAFLLNPLESTLTQNPPVSPLESTLTKSSDLKSHRTTLLQERGGGGCYGFRIGSRNQASSICTGRGLFTQLAPSFGGASKRPSGVSMPADGATRRPTFRRVTQS
jgi:hypothetical protein